MTPAAIRTARKALGLSIYDFAHMLAIGHRQVRRYEDGTSRVPGSVSQLIWLVNDMEDREGVVVDLIKRGRANGTET